MIRSRIVPAAIAVMLVILVSSGVALSAAPGGNPLDQVLAKLDQIIAVLAPPAAVPPGPVTLTTTMVSATPDKLVNCLATNLGTAVVPVEIKMVGLDGALLLDPYPVDLAPGTTDGMVSIGVAGFRRCEFTFLASATSIRASLFVTADFGGDTSISAEAR